MTTAEGRARLVPGAYWWHVAVAREIDRLADGCGTDAYPVAGVAGNVGMPRGDVARYVSDLVAAGVLAYRPAPEDWPGGEGLSFVGRVS